MVNLEVVLVTPKKNQRYAIGQYFPNTIPVNEMIQAAQNLTRQSFKALSTDQPGQSMIVMTDGSEKNQTIRYASIEAAATALRQFVPEHPNAEKDGPQPGRR